MKQTATASMGLHGGQRRRPAATRGGLFVRLTALLALLAAGGGTAAVAAPPPTDLKARADAILNATYPADRPGAAVMITRGNRVIYSAGRGLADVERRTPITPDSVFRLGSITKQFTAAAVLQLVQQKRISLDDPVSRFFPDYPRPGASATVRQLLNHTSGIQSYTGIPGWMIETNTNRAYTTAQMIAVFRDLPSRTPPGEEWAYNNSGYVLLAGIIEQVSGKPWYRVIEQMTRRLGIRTIRYGSDPQAERAMVRGYTVTDGMVRPAQSIHMSVPHGAGGLVGSVGDLAKWANALHHGRVVSPALYTLMTSPTTLTRGQTIPYGFGLRFGDVRGQRIIEHGGGIFGFGTESIYIPADDVFVALFTNSDTHEVDTSLVTMRLAALTIGRPYREFTRVDVNPATLVPLFGVYRIAESGVTRRFFSRDSRLYTMREGAPESEVYAAGDDHFFYPNNFNWFRVQRRPDGSHVMEMHQGGGDAAELATRSGDIPPETASVQVSRAVLQSYVGRYVTEGPTAEVMLGADGVLTIQLEGQPALPLKAKSAVEFEVERVGATITFHPEGGRVNRFVINQGGRQLQGQRVPQ